MLKELQKRYSDYQRIKDAAEIVKPKAIDIVSGQYKQSKERGVRVTYTPGNDYIVLYNKCSGYNNNLSISIENINEVIEILTLLKEHDPSKELPHDWHNY